MRSKSLRLAVVAAASLVPVAALASPPWFVDWAHTAPFQKFLIRIYYLDNLNGHNRSVSLPRVQLCYGVTPQLELNIRSEDLLKLSSGPSVRGTNDTVLAMKYRFYKDKRDTELGFGYSYTMRTGEPGIGGGANPQSPYLMASVTPGRFGFYGVVGETYPDNYALREDTYYGILPTYQLDKRWLLMTEVYGNTPTASGLKHDLEYAGGFYFQATDRVRYFARYGHSVEGFSDRSITIGVQLQSE